MNIKEFLAKANRLSLLYIRLEKRKIRLTLIRHLAVAAGTVMESLIALMVVFLVLIFAGLTAVCWIYSLTGSLGLAFASVTVFYILAGIITHLLRKKLFVDPVLKKLIQQLNSEERINNTGHENN